MGLLLDLGFLVNNPLLILAVIAGVLVIKILTTGIGLKALGYGTGAAACSALMLAQVGEFSFVLERTGRSIGLYPAGFETGGPEAFIGATVALMMITPLLHRWGDVLRQSDSKEVTPKPFHGTAADGPPDSHVTLSDHVIIAGYGDAGRTLAPILAEREIPYVIITLSPDGAHEAERGEMRVIRGNYTRRHDLMLAGLRSASLLVVADDDIETTRRVISAGRALNPNLRIFARTRFAEDAQELQEAGAERVVSDEQEGVAQLLGAVLEVNEVDAEEIGRYRKAVREAHRRKTERE